MGRSGEERRGEGRSGEQRGGVGRREEKKMRRKESEEKADRRGEVRERVRVEDRKEREKSRAVKERGGEEEGEKVYAFRTIQNYPQYKQFVV